MSKIVTVSLVFEIVRVSIVPNEDKKYAAIF